MTQSVQLFFIRLLLHAQKRSVWTLMAVNADEYNALEPHKDPLYPFLRPVGTCQWHGQNPPHGRLYGGTK